MRLYFCFYLLCSIAVFTLEGCGSEKSHQAENSFRDSLPELANSSLQERLKIATNTINANPTLSGAYRKRANIYTEAKMFTSALDDINRAIVLDSLAGENYLVKGKILKGLGQVMPAIEAAETARARQFKSAEVSLLLAELHIIRRQYSKAMQFINETLQEDRYNARGYLYRGILALETLDTIKAVTSFETAIELDPLDPEAYNALASFYLENSNPEMAMQYLQSGLSKIPGETYLLYNSGVAMQSMDQLDSALTYYRLSYISDSSNFLSAYNLGIILHEKGEYLEAKRFLRQLAIAKPDFQKSNLYISSNFEALKEYRLAATYLRRYMGQAGEDPALSKKLESLEGLAASSTP